MEGDSDLQVDDSKKTKSEEILPEKEVSSVIKEPKKEEKKEENKEEKSDLENISNFLKDDA